MEIIRKIYGFLIDSVQTFLIAAAIFLVIYLFLFRPYQVQGESMHPNFYNKEYVLTNLIVLRFKEPKLGDVVVFKAPPEPDKDYIKRIIGTPRDTVKIYQGKVYLNEKLLDETKYLKSTVITYSGAFLPEGQAVKIPDDEYFVLGDNRTGSSDSREWGFVKKTELIGESLFVYLPLNRMRMVQNPYN